MTITPEEQADWNARKILRDRGYNEDCYIHYDMVVSMLKEALLNK